MCTCINTKGRCESCVFCLWMVEYGCNGCYQRNYLDRIVKQYKLIDEDDECFNILIHYDDFVILEHEPSSKCFYVNVQADEIYEVKRIATLYYDAIHDLQVDGEKMDELFDNFCCGEAMFDDHIEYIWFNIVN